jgi:hypothetical protein
MIFKNQNAASFFVKNGSLHCFFKEKRHFFAKNLRKPPKTVIIKLTPEGSSLKEAWSQLYANRKVRA